MAKLIEVVLLEDVKDLGRSGDLRKVRAGYARNFLFPKNYAVTINDGTRRLIEKKRAEAAARLAQEKVEAEALLKKLSALTVTCGVKANADGRLFGSVSAVDVLAKLLESGVELKKSMLLLYEPIKAVGEYEVDVRLHPEVKGVIKVEVVAEKAAPADEEA